MKKFENYIIVSDIDGTFLGKEGRMVPRNLEAIEYFKSEGGIFTFITGRIAAGAKVVGTGRSDFPNQVNNVIAFPGIFKGALEGRAVQITEEMKLAAANAIAGLVADEELNENNILPEAFDPRVADVVSAAVKALI